MASSQDDGNLRDRARDVLRTRLNLTGLQLAGPGLIRPPEAQFEVVHPALAGCGSAAERQDRILSLSPDAAADMRSELVNVTYELRKAGIRATADYRWGTVVVSSGEPQPLKMTAFRNTGNPLLGWAAAPLSDVDMVTPVIMNGAAAAAPSAADRVPAARGSAVSRGPASRWSSRPGARPASRSGLAAS